MMCLGSLFEQQLAEFFRPNLGYQVLIFVGENCKVQDIEQTKFQSEEDIHRLKIGGD